MEDGYQIDNEYEDSSTTVGVEHRTSYIIIYTLTIVISLPGNLFIVLSVWRNKVLNDAVWYMLAAISLSLTIHNIMIAFYLNFVINDTWISTKAHCKFLPFIGQATITFTCISLAAMCIMRLLSHSVMKHAFRHHPKSISAITVGIIAVISVAACIPMAIFRKIEHFHRYKFCMLQFPTSRSETAWHTFIFVLSFGIPFLILWSLNPLMYFYPHKLFPAISTETFSSNMKKENQITCLLFMFTLSLTFLLVPYEIHFILHHLDVTEYTEYAARAARVIYLLYAFFPASIPLISLASFYSTSSGILFHKSSTRSLSHTTSSRIQYTSV